MAALLLDEAPSAVVRQWYDNIYAEFVLYCDHYAHFVHNWGCCGRCERDDDDNVHGCGIFPSFTVSINNTLFTDLYIPSIMPHVVENNGHADKWNECGSESCDGYCRDCRAFQENDEEFNRECNVFDCWDRIQFGTNAELESYIGSLVHDLSRSKLYHYGSYIAELMHETLKKFYQVLFVSSGKHTKAARK
jgi:hypothetical protein